jgi:hypothetical protein
MVMAGMPEREERAVPASGEEFFTIKEYVRD